MSRSPTTTSSAARPAPSSPPRCPLGALTEARYAALVAGAATWLLRFDALFDRAAWEFLGHIAADERCTMIRDIPLMTTAQPAHIVHSTLILGADGDMRADASVYGERLLPFALRCYAHLSERLAADLGDTVDPASLRELEHLADLMEAVASDDQRDRIVFEAGARIVERLHLALAGLIDEPAT